MSFKIAFIGAGSLVFARTLFTDIRSVPALREAEISFTDIVFYRISEAITVVSNGIFLK